MKISKFDKIVSLGIINLERLLLLFIVAAKYQTMSKQLPLLIDVKLSELTAPNLVMASISMCTSNQLQVIGS